MSTNPIIRFIQWHWGDTTYPRSAEQLEKEKYILGFLPFNRWLMMPAAVLFQLICGSLYAWSVFNKPIDQAIFGTPTVSALVSCRYQHKPEKEPTPPLAEKYSHLTLLNDIGLSAAIAGPWLERKGPRVGALTGSILFMSGNMLAGLGVYLKLIGLVYFGYGVVGGIGLGICYISPVSPLQKWFPDHRGLASGLAVCGFGAGSIALAKVPLPLQAAVGLPLTFVILGAVYFGVMLACSAVFRVPPPNYTVNGLDVRGQSVSSTALPLTRSSEKFELESQVTTVVSEPTINMTLIESIFSRDYRFMYVMFFGNSVCDTLQNCNRCRSNIITDIFGMTPDTAATIVSINGGFNLAGRLFFSTLSDYTGRKACFIIMLATQVVILGSLTTVMQAQAYWVHNIMIWVLTACYGAGFGIIPAFLTDMFGPSNIGALHGIILTAWASAGVGGGLIFTAIFNSLVASGLSVKSVEVYSPNLWWIFGVTLIGFLFVLLIRTGIRDRLLPRVPGEVTSIRVFGRLIRLRTSGFEVVSREQEDQEWGTYLASLHSPAK
ncbi:uncharacterized protein VTP21DRAFT_3125 [Calcarisporiella thermophila]|uniref:uncharacterized protein n=1 Tax=Calcarisporiella thermophila TaxID=911321 RepID=UPI003742FBA2